MTSKRVNGLYIYLQIDFQPILVGRFDVVDKLGSFFYANSYVDRPDAFAIDPINLPLIKGKTFTTRANQGVFGVLLDGGPDSWGKKVLTELSPSKPRNALEYLLAANGDGCGALLYSLSRNRVKLPKLISQPNNVDVLQLAIQELLERGDVSHEVKILLNQGSALGGARPKAAIMVDGKHYLAKFNRQDDLFNEAKAEKASLMMAAELGIDVPDTHLHISHNRETLLSQRFDYKADGTKQHYISANSILNIHKMRENDPDFGYPGISHLARRFCDNSSGTAHELFKRMAFKVLLGDTDDHARNLGFLYDMNTGKYSLSPMFDVLPHLNITGSQALCIGRDGRKSSFDNLLSMSESFDLDKSQATKIVKENLKVLISWRSFFHDVKLSDTDVKIIEPSLTLVDNNPFSIRAANKKTALKQQKKKSKGPQP